jgi:hypothetical protein
MKIVVRVGVVLLTLSIAIAVNGEERGSPASDDSTLLCQRLEAKATPVGLTPRATAFVGPATGTGRQGANGFVVAAAKDWESQGTAFHFTYSLRNEPGGVHLVHPFRKGHISVQLRDLKAQLFPGGPWGASGAWTYARTSGYPNSILPAAAKVFPLADDTSYLIVSRLKPDGKYELFVNGVRVVTSEFHAVEPQGMNPPIVDENCPKILAIGQAAFIIGPALDGARNEATNIRLTSVDTILPAPRPTPAKLQP